MARILVWTLALNLIGNSIETGADCNELLRDLTFQCQYKHADTLNNLVCENTLQNANSRFNDFILIDITKEEGQGSIVDFQSFFDSNFSANSSVYKCEEIFRSLVHIDPSVLRDHCENHASCIYQAHKFLRAFYVKSVELHDIPDDSPAIQNLSQFFPSLETLRIYHVPSCNLSHISVGSFKALQNLQLSDNNIRDLPNNTFRESLSLRQVDLSSNSIIRVSDATFGILPALQTLNLTVNSIRSVTKRAFYNTPNLKQLYLARNDLTALDGDLFSVTDRLEELDLSENGLRNVPEGLLRNLRRLKVFRCASCGLVSVPERLFRASTKLEAVYLSRNRLRSLAPEVFETQNFLHGIDLSYNQLSDVPKGNIRLRYLGLTHNAIDRIGPNLTADAPNLYRLDLSFNAIERLEDSDVEGFLDLEFLDLSNNQIDLVQLGTRDRNVQLRKLVLSNNSIATFRVVWKRMRILESMEVDNNRIGQLDLPPCIDSVKQTITFSFRNNSISGVGMTSLLEDQWRVAAGDRGISSCFFNGMAKNFVDLSLNPLACDCGLYAFYEYLTRSEGRQLEAFLNKESLRCAEPKDALVVSMPSDAFTCHAVGVDCPRPCACGLRGRDRRVFVNCTGLGLVLVPGDPPPEASVLYFADNMLSDLHSLSAWGNLSEIHLDRNALNSLEGWAVPDSLRWLSLRGNQLTDLPAGLKTKIIGFNDTFRLFFGGNDAACDCSRRSLRQFLVRHVTDEVSCRVGNASIPLSALSEGVLCRGALRAGDTVLLASLCGALAFLVALVLLYYKQRHLLLSFVYARFGVRLQCNEEDEDDDREYDAFVAYGGRDRNIVLRILRELEPRFRLCVHERDWLPGRFVVDNIACSVRSSQRTLVVISEDFAASPWCRVEVRAALFHHHRLIVVLAAQGAVDALDPETRHLVAGRTYLVWGERWFWEKLRYAMPRRSCQQVEEEFKTDGDTMLIESFTC